MYPFARLSFVIRSFIAFSINFIAYILKFSDCSWRDTHICRRIIIHSGIQEMQISTLQLWTSSTHKTVIECTWLYLAKKVVRTWSECVPYGPAGRYARTQQSEFMQSLWKPLKFLYGLIHFPCPYRKIFHVALHSLSFRSHCTNCAVLVISSIEFDINYSSDSV